MDESAPSKAVPMEKWPQQTVPRQKTAQPTKFDPPQGEIIEISESSSSDEEEKEQQLTIVDLDDDDDEEARNEANKKPQEKEEEKVQVIDDDTQDQTSQDTHSDCVEIVNMETTTKQNDTEAAVTVLDLSTDNEEDQEAEEDEQAVEEQEVEKQVEEDEQAVEEKELEKEEEDERAVEEQEVEKQKEDERAVEEQDVEKESEEQDVEKQEEEDEQAVEEKELEKQEEDERSVEEQEVEKPEEDEQAVEEQDVEKESEEQDVEKVSEEQEVEKESEEQEVEKESEEQEVEKEEEEQEVEKEKEEQEIEKEEGEQEVEKEEEEQEVEKEEEEMEEGENDEEEMEEEDNEKEQKEEFKDHMVKHLKVVESLQTLPKLNGNHSISIHDLDDNSCSSAASSTSSLNLVIDHPLAEETPPQKLPLTEDHEKSKPIVETKSLKRKLSECEGDSPQHKQLHLDPAESSPRLEIANTNSGLDSEMECTIISPLRQPEIRSPARTEHVEEVHKSDAVYEKCPDVPQKIVVKSPPQPLNASETSIEPPPPPIMKPPSPNPFSQYIGAPAKSLTVPKLNFDCFKCKSAVFETFTQLRDHLKACLFKENHKKTLPALQGTIPTPQAVQTAAVLAKDKTSVAAQPELKKTVAESPVKKRFYLCSSCGTYHENWNLFLHIREIHNRHVCLYCIRLFPTAEKLSLHLEIKHDLEQNHFNSEDKLRSVSKGDGNSRFLMCCTCQHVFSEHERFSDHVCTEYMQPCSLCHQKGRHLNNCKANPEKRPKAKKKPKAPPAAGKAKSNIPVPKSSTATPVATTIATTVIHQQNTFNNNQLKLPPSLQIIPSVPSLTHISPELPKQNGFALPHPIENRPQKHSEEYNYQSDDSTNMVIDETCSSNNYITQMAGVNPFKALDERERLQEEMQKTVANKPTLPPDRVPEAIPEPKPLIVPKIKLRVPKEFQKAVESEIYSTDSDDDEDMDEDQEKSEQQNNENNLGNSVNDTNSKGDDSDENDACSMDEKDNTQDGDDEYSSNSNLDRILKEIEKTKLDIQRTKEMLEPMNNLRKAPPPPPIEEPTNLPASPEQPEQPEQPEPTESTEQTVRPSSPTDSLGYLKESMSPNRSRSPSPITNPSPSCSLSPIPVSPIENRPTLSNWETPEYGMYSPTPPPTPNSVWASPLYPQTEVSPAVLREVSERENIENMEKESEHAKEHVSESEKMDISTDLDVDSVENRENSTMDIDEKPSNSPIHSPPPTLDFTPIVEQNEDKTFSERTAEDSDSKPDDAEDENVEVVAEKIPPADGIEVASDDIQITDLLLDRPLEKFEIVEFVRFCVNAVYSLCLYCNHARRIAVNGHSLVLHLLAQHRFAATVDSITAEELLPSTIVSKLKSFLPDLEEHYFNLGSYCSFPPKASNVIPCDERVFECFQCRFSTKMHKDLYLHNRKMHLKTAILCFMCRSNFFSFSEILCHICPGTPNKVTVFDIKFRCCLCEVDGIPSPFRLMVHLRKKHFACDICLEDCREQGRLSSHVWKHKLHHLCYRCGIAYRNKMDITKHLFWKHGTESINCKRCLQKRWRHVYHFCVPPTSFFCESCNLCFSKATYLRVHKRVHSGDFRYPCTEDNCEEKFISRKLLLKHSAMHAPPPEIKIEEKVENEVTDVKNQPEDHVKAEETPKEEESLQEKKPDVEEKPKVEEKKDDKEVSGQVSKRKKKKNRNKESLEDLNLTAPNLSESDSSGESDNEKLKTEDQDSLVPNVMLSPPSEEEKDDEKEPKVEKDADKIMDIWENFKSFQASQQTKQDEDDEESLTESNYPTPILHVACSDHDYCAMYKIRPRPQIEERKSEMSVEPEPLDLLSDTENDKPEPEVREKSHSPSKKKRKTTASGSSSSDSSSGSDSSCSCGSNCSCSTSGSSSNSSSSSDEDSDSSTSEGRRRIAEKKQQRAEQRNRWKSESSQKASLSENTEVIVEDKEPIPVPSPAKENLEPILLETDLETAESETDEEFYDEHPQKLASELLAEKRLQLRAQMRLSPSHNFDIMENSRPSTPSLPEEMVKERKIKLKKKKRDRKSTCKSQAVPPIKLNLAVNKVEMASQPPAIHQTSMQVPEVDLEPPHNLIASPGVAEPPVAQQPPTTPNLQNNLVKPVPFFHTRMSEGSSCSDADSSLKRSKRARRPNKFYGYTSDDENTQGTPLMIGSRTFKPQPPPQLTWRKEDLPAPSKSILLNKQPRSPRTPRTPKTAGVSSGHTKKRVHQKSNQIKKKKQRALPPIPLLKIRPSAIGIVPPVAQTPFSHPAPANHTYLSSRDNSDDSDSSDDDLELPAPKTLASATVPSWAPNAIAKPSTPVTPVTAYVKPVTPPPPSPQASAFNQKIPPALLPNPDFATIQYFKRNNIRYPIRPPAGARQARDGESVYCYCRCPYDEVSEMIACDGDNCLIEWFHFECVGIMVAPQGKWFCAECRPKYSNELYPQL